MICLELPIYLPSAGNMSEHRMAKHRRVKAQKEIVTLALRVPMWGCREKISALRAASGRLVVRLTRFAFGNRQIDVGDNLPAAFKSTRDAIAALVGVDDGSDFYEWQYARQRCAKGAHAIRIEIFAKEKP